MNNGRRVELDVTYNNAPFAGQVGAEIESLTYVDNAADDSDSIDITLDAQDSKWLHGWLPEEGATLRPRIIGRDWNGPGDTHVMECGLFILDDVAYQDAPTTLQVGGVSKPSDTDFSELERETIWKNTSIKRIGESIAGRYGLGFTYDADDYDIECDEQDGTDSSYYNTLCKNYGLILKVYAKRLWVYDRERYKGKRAVQDFDRTNIIPGSLSYNTTLSGTYTGGYFTYTDADKDLDIVCSVGGGNHTKNVNRRATSVYDASVQLCAEINNANHGRVKLKFSVMGNWGVSAGNNLRLTGYGDGLNGGINGKYFVDKVTHKYTKSGGFVTSFECSGIFDPFHYWDVGGHIEYHQSEDSSSESYNSAYETTSPAANAASAAAGATAGAAVTLTKAPFYYTSVAPKPTCYKSGTFYFYDGILVNNRYRITNTAARCGKLPVGKNVTGWVPASYCSPAAVLGFAMIEGKKFKTSLSVPTIYKYIAKGLFLNLTQEELPRHGKKKHKYKKVKKNKSASRAPAGESIEQRPEEIDGREEFGHWEGDTVYSGKGKRKTTRALLTLTERKTRKEIIIAIPNRKAETVVKALDALERKLGARRFRAIFKSITFDNGTEFAAAEELERSCVNKHLPRTKVYFCHPYSSWERGTNENTNGMIRRRFPKGTNFAAVTNAQITQAENWINNYPRKILGYKSSEIVFRECLRELGIAA